MSAYIIFNSNISLKNLFDSSNKIDKKFEISFNDKPINPISINIIEGRILEIKLDKMNQTANNVTLKISKIGRNLNRNTVNEVDIVKSDNKNNKFFDYPITLQITRYVDSNEGGVTVAAAAATITILVITSGLIISNPVTAIILIRLLQSFEFLGYINIKVHTIVLLVLQEFEFDIF